MYKRAENETLPQSAQSDFITGPSVKFLTPPRGTSREL